MRIALSRAGGPHGRTLVWLLCLLPVLQQSVFAADGVKDLAVIRSVDGRAVVRVGTGPLEMIVGGDRVGRSRALVKDITKGRIVLEETFIGTDGRPNVAEIIIRDGETGGTRYLGRPEDKRPIVTQPGSVREPSTGRKP